MPSDTCDPLAELGRSLDADEAGRLADAFASGTPLALAVGQAVHPARRTEVKALLQAAGFSPSSDGATVSVLRAVAGAKAVRPVHEPVWTMPGLQAEVGRLTSEFHHLVKGARQAVTCATYNFSENSAMWDALRDASERPGVTVTVYVDATTGQPNAVKQQLPKAAVFQSATPPGSRKPYVSHTKFVVIDHRLVLLTSANFSWNAENRNVEFGLLIRDVGLATSLENTMRDKRADLYEAVE